jgi:ribonuclease VapC
MLTATTTVGSALVSERPNDEEPDDDVGQVVPDGRDGYRWVLDASAVLALLFNERGADRVADRIAEGAVMAAVNLTEVGTVLIRRGLTWEVVLGNFCAQVDIEPVSVADVIGAVRLYPGGEPAGLSLGERHCLALANRLKLPAVTTEQGWRGLQLGVEVDVVREPSPG